MVQTVRVMRLDATVTALECGGSTPLSFFSFPGRRAALRGKSEKEKKESGVEPPHSKAARFRPGARIPFGRRPPRGRIALRGRFPTLSLMPGRPRARPSG
jgi:hypothetical protein